MPSIECTLDICKTIEVMTKSHRILSHKVWIIKDLLSIFCLAFMLDQNMMLFSKVQFHFCFVMHFLPKFRLSSQKVSDRISNACVSFMHFYLSAFTGCRKNIIDDFSINKYIFI